MSPAEVTEKLGLHRMRDRSWFVHPSCATSGEVSRQRSADDLDREADRLRWITPVLTTGSLRGTELVVQQRQEAAALSVRPNCRIRSLPRRIFSYSIEGLVARHSSLFSSSAFPCGYVTSSVLYHPLMARQKGPGLIRYALYQIDLIMVRSLSPL